MKEITYTDYMLYTRYIGIKEEWSVEEEEETYKLQGAKETEPVTVKRHDKLFRDLLNNKEEFVEFLNSFVENDSNLRKQEIEKYNTNFITRNYNERQSDVIYKLKDKDIFFLIEHQSRIDYSMPYRMTEYSFEVIRGAIDRNKIETKGYEFPKVVPILLYTGNETWNVEKCLKQKQYKAYEEVGLDLKYYLVDINKYDKSEILGKKSMVGYAGLIEKSKSNEELEQLLKEIAKKINTEEKAETIRRIMNYILKQRLEEKQIEEVEEIIEREGVDEAMITLAERLREGDKKILAKGISQGLSQGHAQGISTAKREIAKMMLEEKADVSFILRVTGLTKEELEKIKIKK